MKYYPEHAALYAAAMEMEDKYEREAELIDRIDRLISRLNEEELKLILAYTGMVYKTSDAYQADKLYAEYLKKHEKGAA